MQAWLEAIRDQRQIWAWAVVVGLFMILVGKAPAGPVFMGVILASTLATLRSWRKSRLRTISLPDGH